MSRHPNGSRTLLDRMRTDSARIARRLRSDRGDIPGWVLVTVMTAGLVTAVWLIADGQLTAILNRALVSVSSM